MTDENNREVGREGQSSVPSDDGRTVVLQQTQGNGTGRDAGTPAAPEEERTVILPGNQNHQMDDIQKILKASQESGKKTGSKQPPKKSRKPILIGGIVGIVLVAAVAVGIIFFIKPGKAPANGGEIASQGESGEIQAPVRVGNPDPVDTGEKIDVAEGNNTEDSTEGEQKADIVEGGTASNETESSAEVSVPVMAEEFWTMKNDKSIEPQWPESTLDPKEVYAKIQYNTHMFYGAYGLVPDPDNNDEIEKWYADMNFDMHQTPKGRYLTDLPWRIVAGPNTMNYVLNNNLEHDWMSLDFYTEDGNQYRMHAAYEVEGNVLRFTEVFWEYDRETETLAYELGNTYEYLFSFNGVQLTLSYGDKSVVLQADGFDKEVVDNSYYDDYQISADNRPYSDSDKMDGINRLSFLFTSNSSRFYINDASDNTIRDGIAQISKDGRFRFAYSDGHRVNTKYYYHEYVFFYCGRDGIILTDGDHYYYYQQNYYGDPEPYYPIP